MSLIAFRSPRSIALKRRSAISSDSLVFPSIIPSSPLQLLRLSDHTPSGVGDEAGEGPCNGVGVGEPSGEGEDAAGAPGEGSGVGTETVGSGAGIAAAAGGVPAGVALCSAAIN